MVIRWRGVVLVIVLCCSGASFHVSADKVLVAILAIAGEFLSAIFCPMVRLSAIEAEVFLEASLFFFRGNLALGGLQVGIVDRSGGSFLRCYARTMRMCSHKVSAQRILNAALSIL